MAGYHQYPPSPRHPGSFAWAIATAVVLWLNAPAAAQTLKLQSAPQIIELRTLYEAAEYDKALSAAHNLPVETLAPDDAREVSVYEGLCFLALGNKPAAEATIEQILKRQPLYVPWSELPKRYRTLVDEVRLRIAPALAQERYLSGKASFEAGRFKAAVEELDVAIRLEEMIPPESPGNQSDLRVLASGFRDLAARSIEPAAKTPASSSSSTPPIPPPPSAAAAPAGRGAPAANRPAPAGAVAPAGSAAAPPAVSPEDADVVPPVTIRQEIPAWPASLASDRRNNRAGLSSVLEVTIAPDGKVTAARLSRSIQPFYDALVISAARRWSYKPATRNGVPVAYVKRVAINIQ